MTFNNNQEIANSMIPIQIFTTFTLIYVFQHHVRAQTDDDTKQPGFDSVHPDLAVIFGILSTIFSISFLLLVYAKLCHSALFDDPDEEHEGHDPQSLFRSISGIERRVIDSLPFFTFASLKGSKEGLECAVCLSKFEDSEVLRLLPQCKHAFHINCIDVWLESHSSCPLCRCKLDVRDLKSLSLTNSLRFPRISSNLTEEPQVEIFVEREQELEKSFRFIPVANALQKLGIGAGRKEEHLIPRNRNGNENYSVNKDVLHKLKHKIVVSDFIYKNRWSDLNSSDLMFLSSEMLCDKSSKRFSPLKSSTSPIFQDEFVVNADILKIKEDMERKRMYESKIGKFNGNSVFESTSPGPASNSGPENQSSSSSKLLLGSADKRSMSEIINIPRYADFGVMRNRHNDQSTRVLLSLSGRKDEIVRKLWLPIATKTVHWFAGREREV